MPVAEENVTVLMGWLSDPEVTSASYEAQGVNEDLAALVFQGDLEWANYQDRAGTYAQLISPWLTGATEGEFIALTVEGGDPAAFFAWVVPVLAGWHESAAQDEAGQGGGGLANPNYESDPTPGTQFYRYDEQAGAYLYGESAGGADWAPYEQRRYSEPAWDEGYGLSYRYDKRDELYEWYDEDAGTWNPQSWADVFAAQRRSQAATAQEAAGQAAASAGAWDENWQMFYRLGPAGTYEYADAVVPGDESSGCTEEWLTYEQVLMRSAQEDTAEEQPAQTQPADLEGLQAAPKQTVQPQGLMEQGAVMTEILSELGTSVSDLAAEADIPADELAELLNDPEFAEELSALLDEQDD